MNKKILIIISILLVVALVVTAYFVIRKPHTVSEFSIFPCRFDRATSLAIESAEGRLVLSQAAPGEWRITSPYSEQIAREPHTELMQFLIARMFIDEQIAISPEEKSRLQKASETKVSFYNGEQLLCGFTLGQGYKLPTVDAERRWVFPEGSSIAYRTFVPLMDFGQLFEQPFGAWRERLMMQIPANQFAQIELTAPGERLVLSRVEGGGVQDYRLVSAMQNDAVVDLSGFEIDDVRVATLIDLATPLVIDDWAENVDDSAFNYSGRLTVRTKSESRYMEIGPEVDLKQYPKWAYLGEGARFVRNPQGRVGIVSAQRLLGLFPSLNDLRSKKVWHIDTTRISAIDMRVVNNCLRYLPASKDVWTAVPCAWYEGTVLAGEPEQNVDMKALAMFAQTVQRLEAVRYAEPQELAANGANPDAPAAELFLFFDLKQTPAYVLRLSQPIKDLYRYAVIREFAEDGGHNDGPAFVLSEGIVRILLGDMR